MFLKSGVNFSLLPPHSLSLSSLCLFVIRGEHLERHLSFNCLRIGLIIARALFHCLPLFICRPSVSTLSASLSASLAVRLLIYLYFTPTAHFQFDPLASGNGSSSCSSPFQYFFFFSPCPPCALICPAASCLCILNCCSCSHFHFFRCYCFFNTLYSLKIARKVGILVQRLPQFH